MAAGRHGGYRDNEFRVRESDLKLMRRNEFYYPTKQESDRRHHRKGGGDDGRRETVRSVEVKKGGHYLSLINNSRGGGFSDDTTEEEREPGELVTGIRSDDDATFLESQPHIRDKEVPMSENGIELPARKKRKFSPIVWDDDREKKKKEVAMPMIINPCSGGEPKPKTGLLYSSSALEQLKRCDREHQGQLEGVDIVPEGVVVVEYEEEDMLIKRRKEMTGSQPIESNSKEKHQSLEQGEMMADESEGIQTKASEEALEDDSSDGSTPVHYSDADSEDEKWCSGNLAEQVIAQPRSIDMLKGCRSVHEFERLNKIDEGTYGVVFRARDKKTGEVVALKKVKMEKEREGFPLTSLREINILLSSNHPSIVDVKEVVMGDLDSIFMVMEYMDHDLKGLMETQRHPFSQSEVKCLMLQLLEGVKYLHDNWVLHRDLKTSNILFNNRGELKICDFGMSRQYGSPPKPYTQLVVTLWYRAPEILLGEKQYSTAIDMWSLGCIMAELLAKEPLFNGKTEIEQIDKIFRTLGTPSETIWPGFSKLPGVKVNFVNHRSGLLRKKFPPTSFTGSPVLSGAGFDLLNRLLTYDPEQRITAEDAVNHQWFREVPLPKSKDFMPTFPAQHTQDRRSRRVMKSPDPLEEQRRRELQQGESGSGGLFG